VFASSGEPPFDFTDADLLALLLNEYLWRELLVLVGAYFQNPGNGLLLLSCIATLLCLFQVVRRAGVGYAFVFLAAPLVIDLFMSQTRSALAVAIFMSGLPLRKPVLRYTLFGLAFLVHSFGAVLFVIYLSNSLLATRDGIADHTKLFLVLVFGLMVSAIWTFLGQDILVAIGDRRAEQEAILPASMAFAGWWVLLTWILVSSATIGSDAVNYQFTMTAVSLQSIFIFTTIFGGGGLRFLSLSLPFMFIAIRSIREIVPRACAILGTIAFNIFHSYLWMT